MNGFFLPTEVTSKRQSPTLIPRCGSCGLKDHCKSPKMPVYGKGKRKILVIGEAPGRFEDDENRPFVGQAGQFLRERLDRVGLDLDTDCWTTNALICRPSTKSAKGNTTNRAPTPKEIEFCRPNVINTIKALEPETILLLGAVAVKSVLGWIWKNNPGELDRWVGWQIPYQKLNCWICPTWHPSHLMRDDGNPKQQQLKEMFFVRHLQAVADTGSRPWKKVPDYASKVRCLTAEEGAKEIAHLLRWGDPIAFDFETDRKKPDHPDAEIVCCGVANSVGGFAFPWHGEAVSMMEKLIASDVPKILYNAKFEARWTMAKLGVDIGNVVWDGMLAAHILDNRTGVTSLQFQEFVTLGVVDHKEAIKPYLESVRQGGNEPNRIREVALPKLLMYCATDAFIEHKLAKQQAKQMGGEL